MENIISEEKKVMPADLLSFEEKFRLIDQGCDAGLNGNFAEAERILVMFKQNKSAEDWLRAISGEEGVQKWKDKGMFFGG